MVLHVSQIYEQATHHYKKVQPLRIHLQRDLDDHLNSFCFSSSYHVSLNMVDSVTNNGTVTLMKSDDMNFRNIPFIS